MLDKADASELNKAQNLGVGGWFLVEDDLLDARTIRQGYKLGFKEHRGDLVSGRIYLVCQDEEVEVVARVYTGGGRFETACKDPDLASGFAIGPETTIEGVVTAYSGSEY